MSEFSFEVVDAPPTTTGRKSRPPHPIVAMVLEALEPMARAYPNPESPKVRQARWKSAQIKDVSPLEASQLRKDWAAAGKSAGYTGSSSVSPALPATMAEILSDTEPRVVSLWLKPSR